MSLIRRTPFQRKPHPDGRGDSSLAPRNQSYDSVVQLPRRTVSLPRGKRMRPRSERMAKYYRDVRVPAVRAAVGDGTNPCQARTSACTGYVQGIHEVLPRGRAGGLKAALRDGPTLDCCHRCNNWISEHPREAKAAGLLMSSR